ncbi:MAG: hypothetical protein QNJ53_07135 [Pleurocapsa sp. MO_192.B19]|nr:hypothetical protein [Pleurocapsa sp. MO_192.B19]
MTLSFDFPEFDFPEFDFPDSPVGDFSGTEGNDDIVDRSFEVSNDNFSGLQGDDLIVGARGNDVIEGGDGNDILSGAGVDIISGTRSQDFFISSSEDNIYGQDTLTGGEGADLFILGDTESLGVNNRDGVDNEGGNYYSGAGNDDYALITDFNQSEDFIGLNGSRSDYNLGASPSGLPEGIGIYQSEDLIAIVQGDVANLNLEASYFQDSIV